MQVQTMLGPGTLAAFICLLASVQSYEYLERGGKVDRFLSAE